MLKISVNAGPDGLVSCFLNGTISLNAVGLGTWSNVGLNSAKLIKSKLSKFLMPLLKKAVGICPFFKKKNC